MKKLFISLFAIMAMVSCSEDGVTGNGGENNNQGGENTPITPTITLNKSSITFDEYADEEIISFSATVDWIAKVINDRDNEWLGVSPTSGKAGDASIKIKAKDNNTSNDRSASICIKAGSAEKTINVTQKQKDALTVTSSKFEVSAEGGEITIEVKANIDFDYTIENSATSWIEYKTTRALKTSNLVFDIKKNDNTEKRQGKIAIKSGDFNEEVIVYQAGKTIEAGNIYVEVSCSESTLLNQVYYVAGIGPNVTSIQKKDKGYIITLKEGFNQIPQSAFKDCSWLTNIIIGDGVKSIGEKAFYYCRALKGVTIPDSVKSIGEFAFYGCTRLASINIPYGITSINKETFSYCSSLTNVTIPNSVTSIGDYAFGNCSDITSITIPNSVKSIGECAFSGCDELTSVTIPNSVTSIGKQAFIKCENLSAFYGKYASSDNRCLIVNGVLNSFAPSGLTEYTIPSNVTSIGNLAFYFCRALKDVIIPDSVKSIGKQAFSGCSALKSIFMPEGVTSIGEGAFAACNALSNIIIPDSVVSIGNGAFKDCENLYEVTIGRGVKSIGYMAFSGCRALVVVYCKPTTPPSLGSSVFENTRDNMNVRVPAESFAVYKKEWSHLNIYAHNFN